MLGRVDSKNRKELVVIERSERVAQLVDISPEAGWAPKVY